jgi:DNA-binding NarL/FixJ family response regulator
VPDDDISCELKKLTGLMALQTIVGKSKEESASLLSACGFSNKDIAMLISTTEASVRAHISNATHKSKSRTDQS